MKRIKPTDKEKSLSLKEFNELRKLIRKADNIGNNDKSRQDPWVVSNAIMKELYESESTKNFIYLALVVALADQRDRPFPAWVNKALAEGCRQYLKEQYEKGETTLDEIFNANRGFKRMRKAGLDFAMMNLLHEATTYGATKKQAASLVLEKFKGTTEIEKPDTLRQKYERGWYKKLHTPRKKVIQRQQLITHERPDLLKYLPKIE